MAEGRLATQEDTKNVEDKMCAQLLGSIPESDLPVPVRVSAATLTTPATSRAGSPASTTGSVTTTTSATTTRTSVVRPDQAGTSTSGTDPTLSSNVPSNLRISNTYDEDGYCRGPLTGSEGPLSNDPGQKSFGSGSSTPKEGDSGSNKPTVFLGDDAAGLSGKSLNRVLIQIHF